MEPQLDNEELIKPHLLQIQVLAAVDPKAGHLD
jgi:hypothetical protein